jgi:hypothetical protein
MALLTKSLCFYQVYREMWLAEEEIGGDFHSRSTPLPGKDGTAAWYTQSPSWPSRSATLDVGVEDVADLQCVFLFRMDVVASACVRTRVSEIGVRVRQSYYAACQRGRTR